MKIYTEEQVKDALNLFLTDDYIINKIVKILTPIELPSDEEIEEYLKSFPYTKHLDDGQYNDGVIAGAELAIQWIMDKINKK